MTEIFPSGNYEFTYNDIHWFQIKVETPVDSNVPIVTDITIDGTSLSLQSVFAKVIIFTFWREQLAKENSNAPRS